CAQLGGGSNRSDRGEVYQELNALRIPARDGTGEMVQYTFRAVYRGQVTTNGPMGHNWDHSYFERVEEQIDGSVIHSDGQGRNDRYLKNNKGDLVAPPEFYTVLKKDPDATFSLRYSDGTIKTFGIDGKLLEIRDRKQNFMTFLYNGQRQLIRVNDSLGR